MFAKHRAHWLLVLLLLSDVFLVKAQQDADPPPRKKRADQDQVKNGEEDGNAIPQEKQGGWGLGRLKSMIFGSTGQDASKPDPKQGNTGDKSASGDPKPEAGAVKGNKGAKEVSKQGALGTNQDPMVGAKPIDPQPNPVVTNPKSRWKPSSANLAYGIGGIVIGYAAGHFLRPSVDALLNRIKNNSSDDKTDSKSSTDQSPSLFSKPFFIIGCVVVGVLLIGLALWYTKSLWWSGEPKKEAEKKESEQAKDTTSKMGGSLKATDSAKTPASSVGPSSTARSSTGTRSPTSAVSKPNKAATKGSPKSSLQTKAKASPAASSPKSSMKAKPKASGAK